MYDQKLVLDNINTLNPYGLVHKYGEAYSLKETITFFNSIKLTNHELLKLNAHVTNYIGTSFYDNAFNVYDEFGMPMNFIDGFRMIRKLDSELQQKLPLTIKYHCIYKDDNWIGVIEDIHHYEGYLGFTIIGRGSKIPTYIGKSTNELWICFPTNKLSTTLANPTDTFWNTEELEHLFNNIIDAITISEAIKELHKKEYL